MLSMIDSKVFSLRNLRYGLVLLCLGLVTLNYYLFSRYVHGSHHFEPPHGSGNPGHQGSGENPWKPSNQGGGENPLDPSHHGSGENSWNHDGGDSHDHKHGRGGSFDNIHLKKDGLFLYGLALPLLLLTLATLIWNPSTSTKGTTTKDDRLNSKKNNPGDVNVQKWTIICFVVPLLLVMLAGSHGLGFFSNNSQEKHMGWNLFVRICMSLMSPSGYAATWSLSLFLIPVTKHSPILDWLRITPVQALAFHRVAGWTGLWNSILHGFLHLRHLMDVLNRQRTRTWLQQLTYLLVPSSWKCFATQNPFTVFVGRQDPYDGTDQDANQCWLALVNATGMISTLAFVLLGITSMPQIRRYSYKIFYRVHIPSAWIMLIMAIWHYPTCALVLIPNIIYYLSFNIPVCVTQMMDKWKLQREANKNKKHKKPMSSPLVQANLIKGGSIELIFATLPDERRRHESRYARLSCPKVSPLSHPFSIFSRDDLMGAGRECGTTCKSNSPSTTISILLSPKGPFTEKLTKALFANQVDNSNETGTERGVDDLYESLTESLILQSPTPPMVQVDSFYAGSFDWIDRAMTTHTEILIVAGGVGIVPFLEFLPSLQERIEMDTATAAICGDGYSLEESETLVESNTQIGPKCIHLHWYCREVGLASYVWNNILCRHIEGKWENNSACQGRLKIHVHLTSLDPSSSTSATEGQDILADIPNSGLIKKHKYSDAMKISPVQDARFTQSMRLGLILPGSLMIGGTILHWWWYKQYIVNEMFSHDNLIIRSHSIIFTLALALVVSVPVEHYLRRRDNSKAQEAQRSTSTVDDSDTDCSSQDNDVEVQDSYKSISGLFSHNEATPIDGSGAMKRPSLVVSAGRPSMETVICDVLKTERPAVYSCGPRPLMKSVESAIRRKRNDCAFYREDSEM